MMNDNMDDHGDLLKNNIVTAVKESCDTIDSIILKTIKVINSVSTVSREPGVERIDSLAFIIQKCLEKAVKNDCDVGVMVRGIIIGAFRSSKSVRDEAHKTIDHLVQLIVKNAVKVGVDIEVCTEALIEGIIKIAKEESLNVEVAVSEAGTSAVLAAFEMGDQVENAVLNVLSRRVGGINVVLKEKFLTKQKQTGNK